MNKLHFITAGLPLISENKGYKKGLDIIKELDLDGLEVEFVHGVRMNEENQKLIKDFSHKEKFCITCHGPYYINLNSEEKEKIDASINRIIETAVMWKAIGAFSITFHAAFYMKKTADDVYKAVYSAMEKITLELESKNNNIWIRPETTGKGTQWGTLEEIIKLSKQFKNVMPCIDFAHIHARNNGIYNTYDEFSKMLEFVGNELGQEALNNMHMHIAGIEYGAKGEKKHLNLDESDFNYKELLKAFKDFSIKGVIVCESPNIEDDAKLMKEYYLGL